MKNTLHTVQGTMLPHSRLSPLPLHHLLQHPLASSSPSPQSWIPDQVPHHLGILLSHGVQRATILKPLNLSLVESLRKLAFPRLAILGMNSHGQWLANCQLGAYDVDFVVWVDLIVICRVRESQGKHALLLQVGFMLEISLAMSSR
jgi:hypothetical protein